MLRCVEPRQRLEEAPARSQTGCWACALHESKHRHMGYQGHVSSPEIRGGVRPVNGLERPLVSNNGVRPPYRMYGSMHTKFAEHCLLGRVNGETTEASASAC